MDALVLDVRPGATSGALLGALVETGASLEAVEAAVAALGRGPVRLAVRGDRDGTHVRILAPVGSPTAHTWGGLRPRVSLLALDDAIVEGALATLDALMAARARVHGVAVEDVDVDPLGGSDDLAGAVALAAAVARLGDRRVRTTAVGVGSGTLHTLEGAVTLPGRVVTALLGHRPILAHPVVAELVDPLGAAWLHAHTRDDETVDDAAAAALLPTGPSGRGRLAGGRTLRITLTRTALAA